MYRIKYMKLLQNVLITGANGTGTIPAGGTLPITNFEFHYFQLEAIIF
jgi:hypothetical protein